MSADDGAVRAGPGLPVAAWVTALAALPEVGPARLRALLERGAAADVFVDLAARRFAVDAALAAACGREPSRLVDRWSAVARDLDVGGLWRRHEAAGIAVLGPDDPAWPPRLADDPDPPALLYVRGDAAALAAPSPVVAVVGTRRCSRYGTDVAAGLGRELSEAGVTVVSGLALGVDGAAHGGALAAGRTGRADAAPPVGVVGTGLDVVYPARHRALWDAVAGVGALVSEFPLGTGPARWRFPARNRIIAALADAVVVVESDVRGGAMHTVDEALRRDRPILAVPGPVTAASSAGTNRLLRDVASPCCDVEDVLVAVGHLPRHRPPPPTGDAPGRAAGPSGPWAAPSPLDPTDDDLLGALGGAPATLDQLVSHTGLGIGEAALALERLVAVGRVRTDGAWYEAVPADQGAGWR